MRWNTPVDFVDIPMQLSVEILENMVALKNPVEIIFIKDIDKTMYTCFSDVNEVIFS